MTFASDTSLGNEPKSEFPSTEATIFEERGY
jgi:hypothetical protein